MICIMVSFACATFLSTVCALKTNFEPSPKTTIGIYAAVLFTQGTFLLRNRDRLSRENN